MIKNETYLSWSQYNLFHSSKRGFYKSYGLQIKPPATIYQKFGKEVSDHINEGVSNLDDFNIKTLNLIQLESLDLMEAEVRVVHKGYELLSYLDSSTLDMSEFYEYKTGKNPWTQSDVDKSKQLLFYATNVYLSTGIIPKAKLFWLETAEKESDGQIAIYLTGRLESFEREFTKDELLMFAEDIYLTCVAIDEFEYEEIELPENLMKRYKEIYPQYKELDTELQGIKLALQHHLEENKGINGVSDYGIATLTSRKTYGYSNEVTTKINELKKQIAKIQKDAQKSGDATIKETKSIKITL